MFCYFNEGQSFFAAADDYVAQAGEVLFADRATPDQLAAAFPGYSSAETAHAWSAVRAERDRLLRVSDWTQVADAPLTAPAIDAWRQYRLDLRNVPQAFPTPQGVVWPDVPTGG